MDEYCLSVSKEMGDLIDDQNTSEPSHQIDQSSRQNKEEEKGGCASIAKAVVVGVGLLVQLFWPISVPYVTYRWHKKEYQNLTDRNSSGQNTTEAHISGSTPTTAISSVTDPRPGPALVINQSMELDSDDEVTETCTNAEIVILAVGLIFPLFWPISIPYAIMRYNERPPNRISETGTGSHSLPPQDWYTSQCQPVRLQNFGNTCFFNSALQAFNDHHSPELILEPYMKSYKIPSKTGDYEESLSEGLENNISIKTSDSKGDDTGAPGMGLCQICYDKNIDHMFMPCGHARTCEGCTTRIKNSGQPCPFCRKEVSATHHIVL